jgi:AcrR family transcriptional regulator
LAIVPGYGAFVRSAGEATRERILAAAKKEFAEHGPAGARINRIAAEARASKERLYAYFPSKESLFDAVCEQLVTDVAEQTAMTGDDIPGYVGRLFDNHLQNPENARLHDWVNISPGSSPGSDNSEDGTSPIVANLDESRHAGHIDPAWDSADLILLTTYIAKSLGAPHGATRLMLGSAAIRPHEARRASVVEAARRLVAPADPPVNT